MTDRPTDQRTDGKTGSYGSFTFNTIFIITKTKHSYLYNYLNGQSVLYILSMAEFVHRTDCKRRGTGPVHAGSFVWLSLRFDFGCRHLCLNRDARFLKLWS